MYQQSGSPVLSSPPPARSLPQGEGLAFHIRHPPLGGACLKVFLGSPSLFKHTAKSVKAKNSPPIPSPAPPPWARVQ